MRSYGAGSSVERVGGAIQDFRFTIFDPFDCAQDKFRIVGSAFARGFGGSSLRCGVHEVCEGVGEVLAPVRNPP